MKENKLVYIMGDFNVDLLKYDTDNDVQHFVNTLFSNFILPLITRPTRITNATATLLDNIITNQFNQPVQSGLLYCDITDHLPVFQITSLNHSCKSERVDSDVFVRCLSKGNIDAFKNDISLYRFDNIYNMENLNEAYTYFESVLCGLYEKHFPLRKRRRRERKLQPWMTDDILQSVKHKKVLYKKYLHKPNSCNESKYKHFRNKLNTEIRNVKIKYFERKFAAYKSNIKMTWNLINLLINKGGKGVSETPVRCNGKITNDSYEIANAFNSYFTRVGPNLDKSIPHSDTNFTKLFSESLYGNYLFLCNI